MSEIGVAVRMPGREQTEDLGFKRWAVKTLPAWPGNICLKKRKHSGQISPAEVGSVFVGAM
jgi:hypothetical protein